MAPGYPPESWQKAAVRRRLLLLALVLLPAGLASGFMARVLPHRGISPFELLLLLFFAALYAWISIGFWTSVAGFHLLSRRFDRFAAVPENRSHQPAVSKNARTAVLIPVYNEPVDRIFAGVYAVYRSVQQTGRLDLFDFFILSDTNIPDKWVEEEAAWQDLCLATGGHDRIFYRNRRVNIKRKSGNIADFCRRWGYNYRYMIVFDADSVMTGKTLLRLVAAMEDEPAIGILQTVPGALNAKTFFARLQQFASRLYGPMLSAGLHFWQLGDAQYWGHNAIIRIEPFMKHCALPTLSGKPPLGGEILSHDFVEAALMRRAGWGVWLAYNLEGSYEELPPNLLEELKRDRRWCQGNMQHLRLLFTKGLYPAHRALFLGGAMVYVSGLLWFFFLVMSTAEAIYEALVPPVYFPASHVLFPRWPVWNPGWAVTLAISTAILLFIPKLLAVFMVSVKPGRAKEFGGVPRLWASAVTEALLSALLAPIRMIFHSKFVFVILCGREVGWNPQRRSSEGTSWLEALRFHGTGMAIGLAWSLIVLAINPSFFWWLTPILLSLVLSVPLSVWSSRPGAGRRARRLGFFLTPGEIAPPRELRWIESYLQQYPAPSVNLPWAKGQGFALAVADPRVHALHLSLLRKERTYSREIFTRRRELREKALALGPEGLSDWEKKELLCDPASLSALHHAVWTLSNEASAARWGLLKTFGSC